MSVERFHTENGTDPIRMHAADLALEHADPFGASEGGIPDYPIWSETVDVIQTDLERAIHNEVDRA